MKPTGAPAPSRRRRLLWVAAAAAGLLAVGIISLAVARGARPGTAPEGDTRGLGAQATRTLDQLMADGTAMLDQGDPAAAVADYQAAVSLDPRNLEKFWEIASILEDYGYPEDAAAFVGMALANAPDDPSVHDTAAWQYYDLGHYSEAISEFQRILDLDPAAIWPLVGQAQAYQAMDDLESARTALDTAMSRPPVADSDLYDNIGWGYSAIEAWSQAQAAFRQALGTNPADVSAWGGLADATYNAEGVEVALGILHEAQALNPSDASLHEKAGWYAWELGDAAAAEAAFLRAIELNPAYTSAYSSLANIYGELNRIEEAVAILLGGIEANPSDPSLREALGKIYLDRGEAQPAFEQFQAAFELAPDSAWLGLEAAMAYYRSNGDADGSAGYLEKAAEISADDPYLLEAIGLLYEEMGNCERGAEYFRRALEIDSTLESSQAGLGRCLG